LKAEPLSAAGRRGGRRWPQARCDDLECCEAYAASDRRTVCRVKFGA